MKLFERLQSVSHSWQVGGVSINDILTITRSVLCALGDDLIENEPEATDTIKSLVEAVASLPPNADAVMATDYRRALDREKPPKTS